MAGLTWAGVSVWCQLVAFIARAVVAIIRIDTTL